MKDVDKLIRDSLKSIGQGYAPHPSAAENFLTQRISRRRAAHLARNGLVLASLLMILAVTVPALVAQFTRGEDQPLTTQPGPELQIREPATLPTAHKLRDVPWGKIGKGWLIALYENDVFTPERDEDGSTVLYLIDPEGVLYEVTRWGPTQKVGETAPYEIIDWSPTGETAILLFADSGFDQSGVWEIDLRSTRVTELDPSKFESTGEAEYALYVKGYTWPTGSNLVVSRSSPGSALIRTNRDGKILSTLWESESSENEVTGWLYRPNGREVVIGSPEGLRLVRIDGSLAREWPTLPSCAPVRWWTPNSILASCPDDQHFSQLWVVPIDGAAPFQLTALSNRVPGSDFGYHDAVVVNDQVFLQWSGDCCAGGVERLISRSESEPLLAPAAGGSPVGSIGGGYDALLTVSGNNLAIWAISDPGGSVFFLDPSGKNHRPVLLGPEDVTAVTSVVAFPSLLPEK